MKKSLRVWTVIALEVLALTMGAYTAAALLYHERLKLLGLAGLLCLLVAVIGVLVTRAKAQRIAVVVLVLGLLSLGVGVYFRLVLHYHERAYLVLGTGTLCLLGGLLGLLMSHSRTSTAAGDP